MEEHLCSVCGLIEPPHRAIHAALTGWLRPMNPGIVENFGSEARGAFVRLATLRNSQKNAAGLGPTAGSGPTLVNQSRNFEGVPTTALVRNLSSLRQATTGAEGQPSPSQSLSNSQREPEFTDIMCGEANRCSRHLRLLGRLASLARCARWRFICGEKNHPCRP